MVTFFQKLKAQQGGGGGPSFLASHPDPGNRAKNVESILSRFPAKEYKNGDSAEFIAAKDALANVSTETTAKNAGQAETLQRLPTKELASQEFKAYDHGAFRVSYPINWEAKGDRNTSLTLYPPGGASAETVAYGAILSGFTPRRSKDLDGATGELLSAMQDTNPGLKVIGRAANIALNGRPAKSVELLGTSPIRENGEAIPERLRLVALRGKGNLVLYMIFVAPNVDFDALDPAFKRMMRSFVLKE
jgi:beta-barrel assembly-enhancing protease